LSSPTFRRPPPSPVFPYTTRFRSESLTRTGVPARHAGVRLPLEATMKEEILRYTRLDRTNHWLVAILFLCAGLSGLALFHPWLFGLSGLFGGGTWTRILHPIFGVVMFILFLFMAVRFAGHNLLDRNDRQWLKQINDVVANRE